MSIETSKRFLAKATANELEEYKKWLSKWCLKCTTVLILNNEPSLEMDPNAARMEFFSKENSANWVVLEKWHEYQLEGIRQQLGRSGSGHSTHSSQGIIARRQVFYSVGVNLN